MSAFPAPFAPFANGRAPAETDPRGGFDYAEPPREPFQATDALPGTLEKILVMQKRVSEGQAPFHPEDPQIERGECRHG